MKRILTLILVALVSLNIGYSQPTVSIWEASATGNLGELQQHIKIGADLDVQFFQQGSPLHLAAKNGHVKAVALLIDSGANIDAGIDYARLAFGVPHNFTPLHAATLVGNKDVVQLLLNKGANINAKNMYGETPLHLAFENNASSILNDLKKLIYLKGSISVNGFKVVISTLSAGVYISGELEIEPRRFLIEKSGNLKDWTPIGEVSQIRENNLKHGQGNKNIIPKLLSFIDKSQPITSESHFYRVKLVKK